MPLNTTTANELLALIFNATTWADFAENDSTSPQTTLYVALHTADPGAGGTGTTSEATYTGYARVAVNRNSGGFTVASNVVSNTAAVVFGACTAGSNTITHFSITKASSGASQILVRGALTASLAVSAGITPQFAIGQLSTTAATT
jgi:hypothetical protein